MNFTFLHCADLHLGSPMVGLSLKDERIAEKFSAASREAFANLISRALEERVAFVLIAGDVYDGEQRDNSIGLFFCKQVSRLAQMGIPAYLVLGNHDAASIVTKTIRPPSNVRQFPTDRARTEEIADLRVAIHGRSFSHRAVDENWVIDYPAPRAGWFNIGLLHTSVEGNARHATYAPCSVADMAARGYDYWALGHVHDFRELSREPRIVFPGNLQGRSVRETGPKGAVFVDVRDGRVERVRREIVDRARWVEARVDVSSADTLEDALELIVETLRAPLADAVGRMAAVRVLLTGATSLHTRLRAERSRLADETQARTYDLHDDVWIETLRIETRSLDIGQAGPDLTGIDLEATLAECAVDPEIRRRAREMIGQIAARLPAGAPPALQG